jgi:hypothetical protein
MGWNDHIDSGKRPSPPRLLKDNPTSIVEVDGRWFTGAALTVFFSLRGRLNAAWFVFTGRADAVIWPGNQ